MNVHFGPDDDPDMQPPLSDDADALVSKLEEIRFEFDRVACALEAVQERLEAGVEIDRNVEIKFTIDWFPIVLLGLTVYVILETWK